MFTTLETFHYFSHQYPEKAILPKVLPLLSSRMQWELSPIIPWQCCMKTLLKPGVFLKHQLGEYQKKYVSVFWFLFGSPSSFFICILNEWYFCINSLFTHSKEWELSTAEIRPYVFPRWRWCGSFGLEGRHCSYSAEIPERVESVVEISNMCERVHKFAYGRVEHTDWKANISHPFPWKMEQELDRLLAT